MRCITDLLEGLFRYRYSPCCVLEYVIRRHLLRQFPAQEYIRRHGYTTTDHPWSDMVMVVTHYNDIWDVREHIPCLFHQWWEPGTWIAYPPDPELEAELWATP